MQEWYTVETLYEDTPELRIPLLKGPFPTPTTLAIPEIRTPIKDTFFCPIGVRIREVSLYLGWEKVLSSLTLGAHARGLL